MFNFLNKNNAKTLFDRALKKVQKGDAKGAFQDFSEVIKLDPNHADAHFRRGYLLVRGGRLDRAVTDFETALKLDPKHPNASIMQEMIKRASGGGTAAGRKAGGGGILPLAPSASASTKNDELEELLKSPSPVSTSIVPAVQPKMPTVVPHLDSEQDLPAYQPSLTPDNLVESLMESTVNLEGMEVPHSDTLNNALSAVARPKPLTPLQLVERGIAHFDNDRVDEAIDDFVQALTLDPSYADAYVNLGAIYHSYGEQTLAFEYFQTALQLAPTHPDAPKMKQILGIATKSLWTAEMQTDKLDQDFLPKPPSSTGSGTSLLSDDRAGT
jgi:tetratricopeptide (TPR) repeat protein